MTVVTQLTIRRVLERCGAPCVEAVTAEALHRDCFCVAVDPDAVRAQLNVQLSAQNAPALADAHDLRTDLVANQPVSPGWMLSASSQARRTVAGAL